MSGENELYLIIFGGITLCVLLYLHSKPKKEDSETQWDAECRTFKREFFKVPPLSMVVILLVWGAYLAIRFHYQTKPKPMPKETDVTEALNKIIK